MMNALDLQAGLNQPLIVKLIIYRHAQNILHNVEEVSIVCDLGQAGCYPPYKPEHCTGLVKTCIFPIRKLLACNSPPCPVGGGAVVHSYSNRKKKDWVMFAFVIKLTLKAPRKK